MSAAWDRRPAAPALLAVGVLATNEAAYVTIHQHDGDTTSVLYMQRHPIGESLGMLPLPAADAGPLMALQSVFEHLDPHRDAVAWGIASDALNFGKFPTKAGRQGGDRCTSGGGV